MKRSHRLQVFILMGLIPFFSISQPIYYSHNQSSKDVGIGYFYDINGVLIDGELDISYEPENSLEIRQKLGSKKVSSSEEVIIAQFDGYTFYRFTGIDFQGYPVYRYFLKEPNKTEKIKLGSQNGYGNKKNRIYPQLISSFEHYKLPKVIQESDKLSINHIYFIIKLLKYEWLYRENKKLHLDKDWNPTDNNVEMAYYLKVDSIVGGTIYISNHRKDNSIVNSYTISDKFPDMQVGWYKYYRMNGILKKELFYKRNVLDSIKTYRSNGQLFEVINYENRRQPFIKVFDKEGVNILDENYNGIANVYDPIQQRDVKKEYNKGSLIGVYFYEGDKKVFLHTDEALSYRFFSKFYEQFKRSFKVSKEDQRIEDGISLLNLLVNEKGVVSKVELMKSVNPEIDNAIVSFFKEVDGKKTFNLAKYKGKAVSQHVIVPIEYSSYYRKKFKLIWGPYNYYGGFFPITH